MAPQAKKIRVRCKNVAFYTTESLYEPFFAEQKRKNGAAGNKNWVQPWTVPDFFVDIFFSYPRKGGGPPKEGKKSEFPNFQITVPPIINSVLFYKILISDVLIYKVVN